MVRPSVAILALACVIALWASDARAGEMPNRIGLYPKAGPALAMLDSTFEVTVRGPIVEVVVTQRYQNRTEHATEATYVFPLPADAAVSAMAIRTGNRTIRGAIELREAAQRRYEDGVRAGVAAALLDQERPDVFTQSVAAIPAKGIVDITLRFDTLARYQDGSWELVVPLVVAPRYVPGVATNRPTTGTGRAPDTDRAPDASRVTPGGAPGAGGATKLVLHFVEPTSDVTSPTHELRVTAGEAELTDPKSDHDAIVRWRTPATAGGWVEQAADGGYAAVVVEAAPAVARKGALRVMLIVDRSAAARGDADATARPVIRAMLAALGPNDRVAVTGSDQLGWSTPADVARALEQAWPTPAGAFDLTRVLAAARSEGAPIVLVTGGLVADDRAAIAAAAKLGVPLHVIGVGAAPARGLLAGLASVSTGTLRIAVVGDDLVALAKAALADAANPPAPLTVTWGTLAASEVVPGLLPRVGAGQATIVLARVKHAVTANARARGELFAIETLPPARVVDGATTAMGPLARRWARNRLDELLASRASAAIVTAHALRYGLVSPYTSMVAIGDEVIVQGGVKRSVAVPVSVPAGMKWQAVKRQTTVDVEVSTRDTTLDEHAKRDTRDDGLDASRRGKQTPTQTDQRQTGKVAKDRVKPEKPVTLKKPVVTGTPVQPRTTRVPAAPATAVTQPAPAPVVDSSSGIAARGAVELDGKEAEDDEASSPKLAREASAVMADSSEVMVVSRSSLAGGRFRIATSFGGGVLRTSNATSSLLAVGTRLELGIGSRSLAGIDAALWLVAADRLAGHVLASFARVGIARWFELGLGAGLQLGDGAGPAAAVSLRYHLPPAPRAAAYLRYDGALIYNDGARRGQSSLTLGLEWGF